MNTFMKTIIYDINIYRGLTDDVNEATAADDFIVLV